MAAIIIKLFLFKYALAAACCSGGSSQVAIMTGDLSSQFKVQYSNAAVLADVDANGDVRDRDSSLKEVTETFDFQYNQKIVEYWQAGVSIPVVQKTKETKTETERSRGLGDVSAQLTYEFLPELEYSVWKPKGFLFLSLKLPTAPSGYESTEPLQTDSYGKGFYQLGIGSLFVKRIRSFELLLSPSVVGYRPESYFLDGENRKIEPGLSGIFRYGVTYFFKKQPLQVSAQHVLRYDDKTKIAGLNSSAVSYYQDLILNLNYDFNGYSLSGFYSNQNVFGPSKNTSLETSVGIQFTSSYDL